MIPYFENDIEDLANINKEIYQPSLTYRLDLTTGRILGMIDGAEAIKQAITKILLTERYAYLIYDWYYGIGLEKYIGLGFDYLKADITEALKEGLQYDNRIISVDSVTATRGNAIDSVVIKFSVTTIFGVVEETVVNKVVL